MVPSRETLYIAGMDIYRNGSLNWVSPTWNVWLKLRNVLPLKGNCTTEGLAMLQLSRTVPLRCRQHIASHRVLLRLSHSMYMKPHGSSFHYVPEEEIHLGGNRIIDSLLQAFINTASCEEMAFKYDRVIFKRIKKIKRILMNLIAYGSPMVSRPSDRISTLSKPVQLQKAPSRDCNWM